MGLGPDWGLLALVLCMFTVVPKPRKGGMADPGLSQQREELMSMVAELSAT